MMQFRETNTGKIYSVTDPAMLPSGNYIELNTTTNNALAVSADYDGTNHTWTIEKMDERIEKIEGRITEIENLLELDIVEKIKLFKRSLRKQ